MRSKHVKEILANYYKDARVRARFLDFMGGRNLESATAQFITADNSDADVQYHAHPPRNLWQCLDNHREVGRSLWDRDSLIVDLDIEYVNFDQPALPFVRPKVCHELQIPVVAAMQNW